MANYHEKVTSNYFKVKDPLAFTKELKEKKIESFFEQKYDKILYAVASYDVLFTIDENDNDFDYDDFIRLIQKHICDDEIVVLKSIGNEKLRFLTAYVSIISKTNVKYIDFKEIIENALINDFNVDEEKAESISY